MVDENYDEISKLRFGQHVVVKIGEKSYRFDEINSGSSSDHPCYSASSTAEPYLVIALDINGCPPDETGCIQADVHYFEDVYYTSDENYEATNAKFLGSMRWKRIEDEEISEQEQETDGEGEGPVPPVPVATGKKKRANDKPPKSRRPAGRQRR